MLRRDVTALKKISEYVSVALKWMEGVSCEDFLSDDLLKSAVGMKAIIIGELVKNLSSDFRLQHKEIPWKDIAGFRDLAAHKYETLDMGDVYITVTCDFPELKSNIEKILCDNQKPLE